MTNLLPHTPWQDAKGLKAIIAAISDVEQSPRYVGGAVRDTIIGIPVHDIDLATILSPQMIITKLEFADIKAIPTGIAHGTITALCDGQSVEITTLRRDVSTDGRHATIAFTDDWREDAARRDFTINALYADPNTGEILDYFGGLQDLDARHVRFIGDPAERIAEDHLRILRFFRFQARFGGDIIDQSGLAACRDAAKSLMALSRERIASELCRIIMLPKPILVMSAMIENQIFENFLPEIRDDAPAQLARLIAREQAGDLTPSLAARLMCLLPADAVLVDKIVTRLKLSSNFRKDVAARLSYCSVTTLAIQEIAYRDGHDAAQDIAALYAQDDEFLPCIDALKHWEIPQFPIKGGMLIAKGLIAGPVVAASLRKIETAWIAAGFPNGAQLDNIVDQVVATVQSN